MCRGAFGQAGDQRSRADIHAHERQGRVGIVADGSDAGGENILDAGVFDLFAGDADVAGEDAYADRLAECMSAVAYPQASAGELDTGQVPVGIPFGDVRVNNDTGIFAKALGLP